MAAQIIPFPKLANVNEEMRQEPAVAANDLFRASANTGLHLVKPSIAKPFVLPSESQQIAIRIVEDVCMEHNLLHPAFEPMTERSSAFWATLPMPPVRIETPIAVARRLAHIILPIVELA